MSYTDGNTAAINRHLDDIDAADALNDRAESLAQDAQRHRLNEVISNLLEWDENCEVGGNLHVIATYDARTLPEPYKAIADRVREFVHSTVAEISNLAIPADLPDPFNEAFSYLQEAVEGQALREGQEGAELEASDDGSDYLYEMAVGK